MFQKSQISPSASQVRRKIEERLARHILRRKVQQCPHWILWIMLMKFKVSIVISYEFVCHPIPINRDTLSTQRDVFRTIHVLILHWNALSPKLLIQTHLRIPTSVPKESWQMTNIGVHLQWTHERPRPLIMPLKRTRAMVLYIGPRSTRMYLASWRQWMKVGEEKGHRSTTTRWPRWVDRETWSHTSTSWSKKEKKCFE